MKKVIFYVFIALFLAFVVWLVVNFAIMDAQSTLSDVTPTEGAAAAYKNGDDILTHDPDQTMSVEGYMHVYSMIYIPSAKELQITVKYNKSVYEKLGTTAEDGFAFKLFNTETEEETTDYTAKRDTEDRYSYYRLAFSGVEFSDAADLELVMFPPQNESSFSAMKIHRAGQKFVQYDLSKEEIASLGGRDEK